MGKNSGSAPSAPDPNVTIPAQTAANNQNALFNFGLNNTNTLSPLGSSTFTQNAPNEQQIDAQYQQALQNYYDASNEQFARTGQGFSQAPPTRAQFETPSYTQNITLSPSEQAIFNQSQQNVTQQGQVANTALQGVQNQINQPYNLAGNIPQTPSQANLMGNLNDTRNALYGQATQYLDPQFSQGQDQLDAQLANQGITRGSQAYDHAQQNFGLQKQQAYSNASQNAIAGGTAAQAQLAQTGLANQSQAAQLYTQQYQEPLSLYASLMSGTQPTLPQFSGANSAQSAPTNVLGAYQNQYQGQLNAYNAQVGGQNSQMSGIGSILGSLGSAAIAASDRRLKKDIKLIGKTKKHKLPLYEFSYIWEDQKRTGVMSDDVRKVLPDAVIVNSDGYDMVNYAMVGE